MPLRIALALTTLAVALLAACSSAPASGSPAEVEKGRTLYVANCLVCHGDASTGEGRTELASNHGSGGHTWHHADSQLVDIVLGRFTYPARTMPSFEDKLTEDDVRAILSYIKTGWANDEREYQAEVSRRTEAQQQP